MRSLPVCILVLALAGPAGAEPLDEPPPPPPAAATDGPATGERVVLPAKRLYGQAMLEIELSDGAAFDPVSLAPDVYYGVTPDLTVGLVHSSTGSTGIIGGSGSSLCLGDSCDVYRNFGLDGRYQVTTGKVGVAGAFGLYATSLDPLKLALKLGVVGRYRPSPMSKLAVDFAPSLFIGLTEREPDTMGMMGMMGSTGNKEVFVLPVTALYVVKPKLTALVQTGLVVPFEAAGDLFFVPLSIGASYAINQQLSVQGAFSLLHLLGGDGNQTGFDARSFTIGGGYAF
jgi:hypothetical protein